MYILFTQRKKLLENVQNIDEYEISDKRLELNIKQKKIKLEFWIDFLFIFDL